MKPIESAELSAYLDGELSPARMLEIEMALASDAGLRSEFEALEASNLSWSAAAQSVMFTPQIEIPSALPPERTNLSSNREIICAFLVFILLIFGTRLTDILVLSVFVHAIAMLVMLPWIVGLIREDAGEDFSELP
jgi:anti-sigma factor RsiW